MPDGRLNWWVWVKALSPFYSILLILAWLLLKDAQTISTFYNNLVASWDAFYNAVKNLPYFSGFEFLGKTHGQVGHILPDRHSLKAASGFWGAAGQPAGQTYSFCAQTEYLLPARHLNKHSIQVLCPERQQQVWFLFALCVLVVPVVASSERVDKKNYPLSTWVFKRPLWAQGSHHKLCDGIPLPCRYLHTVFGVFFLIQSSVTEVNLDSKGSHLVLFWTFWFLFFSSVSAQKQKRLWAVVWVLDLPRLALRSVAGYSFSTCIKVGRKLWGGGGGTTWNPGTATEGQ